MPRRSTNDKRDVHPYLYPYFWLDPANWYWVKWGSQELNERMHRRIVIPAMRKPKQILQFGKTLKKFITDNKLSVKINDEQYCMVDGWKFAGTNFGLTAIPGEPIAVHGHGEYIRILYTKGVFKQKTKEGKWYDQIREYPIFVGFADAEDILAKVKKSGVSITKDIIKPHFSYKCSVEIIRITDGMKIGAGFANCSNLELDRVTFSEASVMAMSQTRAIGRAYKNLLGYVMKAAGYAPTPAEEMSTGGFNDDRPAEPVQEKNKNGVGKPEITPKQFGETLLKVSQGQVTINKVKEHFTLTEEQLKSLEAVAPKKA